MKKINLSGKLNLNKTKISELNNEQAAALKGGGADTEIDLTDLIDCGLTGYMEGCDTYPCCKTLFCSAIDTKC